MEKYILKRNSSTQLYAELEVSNELLILHKIEGDCLLSTIVEWIRNLTSGDIILTPKDFIISGGMLLVKTSEGKNYSVNTFLDLENDVNKVQIHRKVNPYSIVHK